MTPLWFVVLSGLLIIAIDVIWRVLARRGVALSPGPRGGSTRQTMIAALAVIVVAWVLDAAGLLGTVITSPEARTLTIAVLIALQIATVLALAMLARSRSRQA